MEADGAPPIPPPLPLSVLRFTGIQSYSYTDQRKVEANVEVTEDRTGDLSLRKPRTSQLSHDCSVWLGSLEVNASVLIGSFFLDPIINPSVKSNLYGSSTYEKNHITSFSSLLKRN